jgi:hypothetical protein
MAMSEVPVDMRATPTFSTSAPSTFSLSAITADVTGRQSIRVNATALSSYTAGAGYIIQAAATTAAYFDFSAEL